MWPRRPLQATAESKNTAPEAPPPAAAPPEEPKAASPSKNAGRGFAKAPPPRPAKKPSKQQSDSIFAASASPAPTKKGGVSRRAAPERPLLNADAGSEEAQQTETAIVATLGLIFSIILLEGIFLAAAGFLPEEWDEFALENIYPAFSPTVGLFLLAAAGYGLYKYLGPQQK